MMKDPPVLVFDSGFGGLSILSSLMKVLPKKSFLYYGDNAFAPYGLHTPKEVRDRTLEIVEGIRKKVNIDAIVVACNTATSCAIEEMRKKNQDIPVIGTEPALKPAVSMLRGEKKPEILVLATPVTLQEDKFQKLLARYKGEAEITLLPAPGLVSIIEQQSDCMLRAEQYLERIVLETGIKRQYDGIVLGCTHFPFVKPAISRVFSGSHIFFDSAMGVAKRTADVLGEKENKTDPAEIEYCCSKTEQQADYKAACEKIMSLLP